MSDTKLAEALWCATKVAEVDAIIASCGHRGVKNWKAVGGRPNNIGTIGMASEPGLAIVERITNMMDAVLELEHARNPTPVASPHEAARHFLSVPKGGHGELTDEEAWNIANRMEAGTYDSGNKKRPTVVVTDRGIGQTADDFPRTLLSLNESNKVDKPWTLGTYGQGGSVAFGFCERSVIISRRHPDLTETSADEVAFTVVMKRFDPQSKKLPNYEYLTDANGRVPTLPADLFPDLAHGTRIIHAEYDLHIPGGLTLINTYKYFSAALFEPVLPFALSGMVTRKRKRVRSRRLIRGIGHRLMSEEERASTKVSVVHKDEYDLDLGDHNGSAVARYWVVKRKPPTAKEAAAESFVTAKTAVAMTLNGQRHDAENRAWIKKAANLSFLYKGLIIQIDATNLTGAAKAEMFASTRERGRNSTIRSQIYDLLAASLRDDDQLKVLNHEAKELLLAQSTDAANEKVRKKLGKYITSKLKELRAGQGTPGRPRGASGAGDASRRKKPGTPRKRRDISDDHLPTTPSQISFKRSRATIQAGGRAHVILLADAKNRYFKRHADHLSWEFEGPGADSLRVASKGTLLGGQARWVLQAEDDAPRGAHTLTVRLATPTAALQATIELNVVDPITVKPKADDAAEQATGPEVRFVRKDAWEEMGFTAKTVGRVTDDDESTTIWLNKDFKQLARAASSRGMSEDRLSTLYDRYQFPVACALWFQQHEISQLGEDEEQPSEAYQDAEMRRLADAVLTCIAPDVVLAGEEEDF